MAAQTGGEIEANEIYGVKMCDVLYVNDMLEERSSMCSACFWQSHASCKCHSHSELKNVHVVPPTFTKPAIWLYFFLQNSNDILKVVIDCLILSTLN